MTTQIIITGPPGSGKSTLLEALEQKGYMVLPEIARQIIAEEQASGRAIYPWNALMLFSHLVFDRFMGQRKNYTGPFVFTDRGIPDTITYIEVGQGQTPIHFLDELKIYPYHNIVFFAPFWSEIYTTDAQRTESHQEAQQIADALIKNYTQLGFTLKLLPLASVDERLRFVEKHVQEYFKI